MRRDAKPTLKQGLLILAFVALPLLAVIVIGLVMASKFGTNNIVTRTVEPNNIVKRTFESTATAKALSRTRQGQSGQGQSGSDLDQMLRDIREIERWVAANTGNLSRCIESGRIDWSRYATSLEVSAIVLTEAGSDWADGSADSYTPYEVQRSVTVLQENIRELKLKCGLGD